MNFIKKIIDGNIDDSVHLQFQKFSKGEFRNRALIRVKHVKEKFTINTGAEFANEFVRLVAEKLGGEKTKVTGAIVSTSDLTGEIDFKDKKQFQGVKRYLMDKEMSGEEIIDLLDRFPKTFFALSFESEKDSLKLKIKPKAPKAENPKKDGEKLKVNFCKLITFDKKIGESFVFEKIDFKEAEIVHNFFIDEMIYPKMEGEKDFAKIREMTKRKGKIVRVAEIDGEEMKREIEFTA